MTKVNHLDQREENLLRRVERVSLDSCKAVALPSTSNLPCPSEYAIHRLQVVATDSSSVDLRLANTTQGLFCCGGVGFCAALDLRLFAVDRSR